MPEPDRQELLTALTTEHFGLAGARAQTTGESSARAALYISAVSSTLVALGFIGQITEVGDAFDVFALTALPTLYVLGLFTFIRVVENGVEDLMLGRAINRSGTTTWTWRASTAGTSCSLATTTPWG